MLLSMLSPIVLSIAIITLATMFFTLGFNLLISWLESAGGDDE